MCDSQIHLNDVGTAFRVTIKDQDCVAVNISGCTTKDIIFTLPDNTDSIKSATLIDSGISGVMQYVTVSGDLNQIGIWQIQGHIAVNGYDLYTNVGTFRVHRNL